MQIDEQGCVTSIDFVAIMKLAEFYVLLPNDYMPIFFDKKKRKSLILKRFHDAIQK